MVACVAVFALVGGLGSANGLTPPAPDVPADSQGRPLYDPTRVVVGFHEAVADPGLGEVVMANDNLRFIVVQVDAADGPEVIQQALDDPRVRYAHFDHYTYSHYTPNEASSTLGLLYNQQWGVDAVSLDDAWDLTLGSHAINIHILDTGVDIAHPDLVNNTVNPPSLDCPYPTGAGIAPPGPAFDSGGHGTHVAGIAAAVIDNELGVVGASQSCITSVRVLVGATGLMSWLASGIDWSTSKEADIISMSLGGPDVQEVEDAVKAAYDEGILLVAAAGNDDGCPLTGTSTTVNFPARYDEVIAVAALRASASWATYSNCGDEVEIAAPGSDIWSTLPGGLYGPLSGTSMATPLVAGIAALMLDYNETAGTGTLSNIEVRCILQETATSTLTGDLSVVRKVGHGRVEAYDAVVAALDPGSVGC